MPDSAMIVSTPTARKPSWKNSLEAVSRIRSRAGRSRSVAAMRHPSWVDSPLTSIQTCLYASLLKKERQVCIGRSPAQREGRPPKEGGAWHEYDGDRCHHPA